MSKWAKVARIARTRKHEGSLIAQSVDGLPFLLSEGMRVWFVPPTLKGPRTACVKSVRQVGERAYAVGFDTSFTEKEAEGLVGSYCLVLKDDLPHDVGDEAPLGLVGWKVTDEELGDLGQVEDVTVNPAQSLLVVRGPRGEVLIPVVDAFITGIDEEARTVEVRIPEGLIGLDDRQA